MSHPRDILATLKASPRKSLSQNFLTSPHWAERLTSMTAELPATEEIWEIGPGLGALTRELIKRTQVPIRLFEYDRKISEYLRGEFPALTLHEGDFLKVDLKTSSPEKTKIAVLSNLPYHLSSPFIFKLLEERHRLQRMVLTFQKEFAERLIAIPGHEAYGGPSIVMQLGFTISSLGTIPAGAFYPAPGVASEALLFEPKPEPSVPITLVSRVVRAGFAHRRKKLSRTLAGAFPSLDWETQIVRLGHSPSARPEELNKEDYVALARYLQTSAAGRVAEKNG